MQNSLSFEKLKGSALALPTKRPFSWKVFLIVMALVVVGSVVKVPALLLMGLPDRRDLWLTVAAVSVAENVVLLGLLPAGVGLLLAGRIGLGLPFIEGWVKNEPIWDRFGKVFITSIVVTIVVAVVGIGFLQLTAPLIVEELEGYGYTLKDLQGIPQAPIWAMFLASFSAGVTEEVGFRLGLMTLFAWLGGLAFRDGEGRPRSAVFWIANFLVALLFGAAHFSNIIMMGLPLSPLLVARTLIGNSLAAVGFGWLYWKRGLESAMLSHFFLDVILYVVLPLAVMLFT